MTLPLVLVKSIAKLPMTNSFFVEPTTLTLQDKKILISPLKVKKLSQATILSAPLVGLFSTGKVDPVLVLTQADTVIQLCALAADLEVDFVGELNAAELLQLLQAVVETNLDFFVQTVMPQITQMMSKVGETAQAITEQKDMKAA